MALKIIDTKQQPLDFTKEAAAAPAVKFLAPWEDDPSVGAEVQGGYKESKAVYTPPEPVTPVGGWLGAPQPATASQATPNLQSIPKGLIIGTVSVDSPTRVTFKKTPVPPAALAKPVKVLTALPKAAQPASKKVATLPPPYVPSTLPGAAYSILDAIEDYARGRKGTLMLVKVTGGGGYKVIGHDRHTGKTKLSGENGMTFNPQVGMREVNQYRPVWR